MIKEYVMNICYYVIITTVLFNLFPDEKYVKYIKLFSGFILIMIVISPFAGKFDKGISFDEIVNDYALEVEQKELEKEIEEYEDVIEKRIKEIEIKE